MQNRLLSLLLLLLASITGYSQSYIIKGSVTDTVNNNELPMASVTLLHRSDSTLETFTRTDNKGAFVLYPSVAGKYIIMISFPGFAEFVDEVNVKENTPVDMGQVALISRTHLLKEFIITKQYAAIKVKGDTTEYIADSFKVKDNATVEALLKKLPGLQVDKNGQIIAQGEKVEKLLVDGEEFFSDDPAVVTKNLQANAVDKVQVFDKKSDQAEFTGIDDGQKTKTINLQLKEDRKKGYFGRVSGGGGKGEEQNYFENQAMVNAFRGKRQLSAFGIMSNTGKIGLGWEDKEKFGGGGGGTTEVTEDGSVYTYFNNDDDAGFDNWRGQYSGQGLPKTWTGGVHFANKWNEEKQHLSSNYRYGKQNIETSGNLLTQYVLPGDSQYFSKETRETFSSGQRNRIDGLYEWKTDSLSSIKITAAANYSTTTNRSAYHTETFTGDNDANKQVLNENDRILNTDAISKGVRANLDWRKKFKKKGRTISLSLAENFKQSNNSGYLRSVNSTGNGNVDQHKENDNDLLSGLGKISYTEPLSKVTFLELNYSLKADNSKAERTAWNKETPVSDSYNQLDSVYSSNYAYNVLIHTGGTNLRFVYKKINFSFGGSVSNTSYNQRDLMRDTDYTYHYTNFFPGANFNYTFSKQSKFNIRYYGYTQQPTLAQIQPLRDNTDPLNVAIGNPSLTQEFNHNFHLQFNNYKVLTGRSLWIGGDFNFTNSAISRAEKVDAIGRRTYQYINVDGNYNGWLYVWYGYRIKELNVFTGVYFNPGYTHTNSYVNGVKNTSDNNNYEAGLNINYDSKNEKFSFRIEPQVTYYDNRSTISSLAVDYWTSKNDVEISQEFPLKFEVNTSVSWYIRQQTSVFDQNNNAFTWNAWVSKKFLKGDALELKASIYDILNQNLGFNRVAQNNYVTEDKYNTIRRYAMLSLTWNFSKTPLTPGAEKTDK